MSTDVKGPKQVVFRYIDGGDDKDIEVDIPGISPITRWAKLLRDEVNLGRSLKF